MKFKTEITLLLLAIVLYISSAVCYSYEFDWLSLHSKVLAFVQVAAASVLLAAAAISYSKRK